MPASALNHMGNVTPNTRRKAEEILAAVEAAGHRINIIYGYNPASKPEHSSGCALDFMVYGNRAAGDWIADYVWQHRVRLGLKWVIWYQRIRSTSPGKPSTWQPMASRGNSTADHRDHPHLFFDDIYTPLPSATPAPKPQTVTVSPPPQTVTLEDPVPEHHETRTDIKTDGKDWALAPDKATVVTPRPKAQQIQILADVAFPEDVTCWARFVSWDGKQWNRPYPAQRFTGGTGQLSALIEQASGGADLRLDVRTDKPCTVGAYQSAFTRDVS